MLWKNSLMINNSEELAKTLDELLALMELDGDESNWYQWMLDARRQLDESPISGASRLIDAYGGMGSFNDHYPLKVELDDAFNKLRSKAYRLATEIIVADRRGGN